MSLRHLDVRQTHFDCATVVPPWYPCPTLTFATTSPLGELVMADHGLGNVPGSDVTEWSQNGLCTLSLADGLALIFLMIMPNVLQ
jgi:hypothetical protein